MKMEGAEVKSLLSQFSNIILERMPAQLGIYSGTNMKCSVFHP